MTSALIESIGRALAAGRPTVMAGDAALLLLAELPSGTRLAIDAAGSFAVVPDGETTAVTFEPGAEQRFVVLLELGRHDFEEHLERGAREAGLPVDDTVIAFPAVALMRAVLAVGNGYTSRLALRWLLPSERAELVPEIAAASKNGDLPQDVRDLARHLSR